MEIETLDDVLNELADKIGVYGCCKPASEGKEECNETNSCCCRVGFMMEYKERIHSAIENEKRLEIAFNLTPQQSE